MEPPLPAAASGTLTTQYDEQGRLVHQIDSNGAEARYTYDAESNLVSRIANTHTLSGTSCPSANDYCTSYSYDAADQLSSEINQNDSSRGTY